ncbi:leucyl aminopeptidase [Patescibacteria group bacterium]|nr:leucyl aminopeptidase [Patescibacteria group bacterium]
MIKFTITPKIQPVDVLIIPIPADKRYLPSIIPEIKPLLANTQDDFNAKFGEIHLESLGLDQLPIKILLVGLGDPAILTIDKMKTLGAKTKDTLLTPATKKIGILFDDKIISLELFLKFIEGMSLKNYLDLRYKNKEETTILAKQSLNELLIINPKKNDLKKPLDQLNKMIDATFLVRNLVTTPSADLKPHDLAKVASNLAKQYTNLQVNVLNKADITKAGLNLLLAVNRGSHHEARLIIMKLNMQRGKNPIVLVGKGITFDSGGYNLKPSAGGYLEIMHTDMAGAATVIGTIKALAELGCRQPVIAIIPATENLISGNSYKPADVIKSYSGLTVEIANTDAEGRLILADAMAYAVKQFQPSTIIDVATLTGACIVALGERYAGLFGNDDNLLNKVKTASKISGDKVWPLPLDEVFIEKMKSKFADISNLAAGMDRLAGASTAAAFLSYFVPKTIPWAHLDIAGPAYQSHDTELWNSTSVPASGFGVALLVELIQRFNKLDRPN